MPPRVVSTESSPSRLLVPSAGVCVAQAARPWRQSETRFSTCSSAESGEPDTNLRSSGFLSPSENSCEREEQPVHELIIHHHESGVHEVHAQKERPQRSAG